MSEKNKYAVAASKGRHNLGFGEIDESAHYQHYGSLWEAVADILGGFAEGEEHMDIFMEECERFLPVEEDTNKAPKADDAQTEQDQKMSNIVFFLFWAEKENVMYGGHKASDVLDGMLDLIGMDRKEAREQLEAFTNDV